ncbi:MAG: ligase-associated DNA damage response endonuclease PdeM [Geminicoccaceae bacterium]
MMAAKNDSDMAGAEPATLLAFAGERLRLDPRGVLLHEASRTLVVADLHLEKGSAFARRGAMLPPYDTLATLEKLAFIVAEWRPERLVSLGDGFHDTAGARLLTGEAADRLEELAARLEWIWVRGNHDETLPSTLPGTVIDEIRLGRLTLRHLPDDTTSGLVAGHLHPVARVGNRQRRARRPCFIHDRRLLLLPAFGSYTGGLNVLDAAIAGLFAETATAHIAGETRLFALPTARLLPDPPDWRRHRL